MATTLLALPAELTETLDQILVAVALGALALVAYAVKVGVKLGRQWIDSLAVVRDLEAKDKRWRSAMDRVEAAAIAGMQAAEQTIAARLRAEAPKPGGLTVAQAGRVMRDAALAAKAHFGPAIWAETGTWLELGKAEVEALVRTRIEAAVARTKLGKMLGLEHAVAATLETDEATISAAGPDATTVRETVQGIAADASGEHT